MSWTDRLHWWLRHGTRVRIRRLEINAAMHCNLNCKGCNHASAILPEENVDLDTVRRDLARVGRVVFADVVRVLGGEPTLHPRIDDLLQVVARARVGRKVCVVTNGTRLHLMTDRFWSLADRVDISRYPGVRIRTPERWAHKTRTVTVTSFAESFSTVENTDPDLLARVWDTCTIKNFCFALSDGHLFNCARAAFIPRVLGWPKHTDGLPLSTLSRRAMRRALSRPAFMKSCAHCTGSIGRAFAHQQVPDARWLEGQSRPVSAMVRPVPLIVSAVATPRRAPIPA